jgi:hypothetical protein
LTTLPSTTFATKPHFQKQISQTVGTYRALSGEAAARALAPRNGLSAKTFVPAAAATYFMKLRLLIAIWLPPSMVAHSAGAIVLI